MSKCIIITSYLEGELEQLVDIEEGDYVICADAGYRFAKAAGITPSIVIGDFDSGMVSREDIPAGIPVISHPSHKDFTDTELCIEHAKDKGFKAILIIGGFGGRVDHTIANLQSLFYFYEEGMSLMMADGKNIAFPLIDADAMLPKREGWTLSVFAHSEKAKVTITGAEYPLEGYTLENDFPLGVSNSIVADEAYIAAEGKVIVVMSKD